MADTFVTTRGSMGQGLPDQDFTACPLTVIVPAYNEIGTISQVLARLRELPTDYQIIIVDDGSRDGTEKLLDQYPSIPAMRILRHESNQGKSAAPNRASACKGYGRGNTRCGSGILSR